MSGHEHSGRTTSLRWSISLPLIATPTERPWLAQNTWSRLGLFAVAFILAFKYATVFSENNPAPLWFPDSVLLCAFLLTPSRQWWPYLFVGLAIRLTYAGAGQPVWFLVVTYLNDCLKALFSVYLLRRFVPSSLRLNNLRELGIYFAIAGVAMPAVSAIAGAATLLGLHFTFWSSCYQWFMGDAIAALVLTPTLLYWCSGEWQGIKDRRFQFFGFIVALSGVLYFMFMVPHASYSLVLLYAPVPFLILAATRFKPIGVSTAISLIALLSILSAVKEGPLFTSYSSHGVLLMQLFLIVVSVPMLNIAILIEERRGVEKDLKENRAILAEKYQQVEDLAGRLLHAQEEERQKIAREIHDDIGQRLALLSISLDQLHQGFSPEREEERSVTAGLVLDAQNLASDLHDLSHELHSSSLQQLGLETALRAFCRNMARQHHISVEFHSDNSNGFSKDVDLCLFRVAQEAVNNAIRHGNARRIDIQLRQQGKVVLMRVADTGTGFDPTVSCDGLGLVSMRERLRLLGGRVIVKSAPGTGTEVTAELPFHQSA